MPSTESGLDRLQRVLSRALHRADLTRQAKKKLVQKTKEQIIAEDYAQRLAEKHLIRGLLSEERMDGLRFRWYFTHVNKDTPLDELRAWIDAKVLKEKN